MNGRSTLHIAIDGCVGVGKTTLATKLAEFRKATLVLEEYEKNPFLSDFYRDPIKNALETEMGFLLVHYHQLKEIRKSTAETITDFTFQKDLIFGELNFHEKAEKEMFERLYEFLHVRLSSPDLVIYLKGSEELIISRIRNRGRDVEQTIDPGYFRKLKRAYDEAFMKRRENVHIIDADNFDCLNDRTALAQVSSLIDSTMVHAS